LIEEGLCPGERVVVEGQFKLQKGSRVKTADAPGAGGMRSGGPAKPAGPGEGGGRRGKSASPGDERGGQAPGNAKP
jgi:multidrug efflux system membrane fusion protein